MKTSAWVAMSVATAVALSASVLVARGVAAGLVPAESYVTQSAAPRAQGEPLPVLFRAPDFDLVASSGERVTLASLAGKVWIANFIFSQCTTVCPTMTARLVQLERQMPSADVRFVSVSVDPEHDTPEALRAYAEHWPPEPRWLLLSASRAARDDFARGLRVAVVPSGDPKNPIIHSRLLTLVDGEGRVRAVYDADDAVAWKRIAADAGELAATLSHASPPLASAVAQANAKAELPFARLGCTGCHDRPEVAPPLSGGTRSVMLATGDAVMADEAYLRESLLAPAAKMVAGYAPIMPSYKDLLTRTEIDELVVALRALPSAPAHPVADAHGGPAEDPVCHMKVSTVDPALTLVVDGRSHHFCSRECLESFAAKKSSYRSDPEKDPR